MIPPITSALIADAIQSQSMVTAGHAYWLQGRVKALKIDAELRMISAEVKGSEPYPYEVTILFPDTGGVGEAPNVDCTCPVGFDCKHGAAVLFSAQARQTMSAERSSDHGSMPLHPSSRPLSETQTRPVPLPPSLQQWLAVAQTEAKSTSRLIFQLAYVFTPRASHDGKSRKGTSIALPAEPLPQRVSVNVWLWGHERDGRHGQARWFQPNPYDLREGRLPLALLDQWLVRRMANYGGDLDNNGTPIGIAGADWLEKVIATGNARWRKADGTALRWGEDRHAKWRWVTLPGGDQRLSLDGPGAGEALIATAPPIVVDEASGMAHRVRCDIEPALGQRLLLMPAVPPAAVPRLAEAWPVVASEVVPAPSLANMKDLGRLAPVPVLTFLQDKVEATLPRRRGYYSSYTMKRDMALARVTFDYSGTTVTPATVEEEMIKAGESGLVRFARDLAAEATALEAMAALGLTPLDAFPDIRIKPIQLWDYAPHAEAAETDFAAFMQAALPRLRARGWRIAYSSKWRLSLTELGCDDLQFDVTPSGTDWFDISLGARIDGRIVDILPVLRQLLASGGQAFLDNAADSLMIAIGPGKLAKVPTEPLKPILAMLLDMALHEHEGKGSLHLPRRDLAALAGLEQASGGRIGWRGGEELRLLGRELTRISTQPTAIPDSFKATLRPYQQQGVDWLQALHRAGFGGVLADDMGLGKTVQALAHIATLKAGGRLAAPVLILCPTSVLPNWQAEIARFMPDLTVLLWHGNDRRSQHAAIPVADIILSSYPLLLRDHEMLAGQDFGLIFYDEAQLLKNPKTAGFRAARMLKARQIIALSGTPVENQLTDLWSLMELVTPGLLGPLDHFRRTIDRPIVRDNDSTAKAVLRRRLRPFMLRRTKDEVARDLPEKTEIPEWIDLEKNQMASYESLRLLMQKRVRDEIARVGLLRSQIIFLDALLKLRQICCDPRLVPKFASKGAGSAKLDRLLEMLPELVREGRRIILFSQFTTMLDLIKPELEALHIGYAEIRGETQDRETPVGRFQARDVPLILVSLKAGGTGLNLTTADTVILYDPWWNPAVEAQAIDRAHRIGQSKPVFVHRLIARGTIEEKILSLQDRKRALAAVLWEGDDATNARLTEEDIAFLLG